MKLRFLVCGLLLIVAAAAMIAWHRAKQLHPVLLPDREPLSFSDDSHSRRFGAYSLAAHAVRQWIAGHRSGWKFSSTPFDRHATQIGAETYGIALIGNKILLDYKVQPNDDDDDDIHLERMLSPDERTAWQNIIVQILAYNAVLEPPLPASNHMLQPTAKGGG